MSLKKILQMTDEEVIGHLTELLGPQGFAQVERFNEQLRKNPPTKAQARQIMKSIRQRGRDLGVTDEDVARIKMELFGL